MTANRTGGRTEKNNALINNDQMPHAMLSRSRSVNSNLGKASPNNISPNIARRMCSVDSLNHNKDGTNSGARTVLNSKFPDKGQLRQSPRAAGAYVNEGRGRSDSPFGACPSTSFESTLPTNPVKNKLRTDTSSASNIRLNHLMSRTSSSNSISDLSPCSVDDNSSNKLVSSKASTLTIDSQPSSATYTSTCNNTTNDAISVFDNNLLSTLDDAINIDSLRNDNIGLDAFEFSSSANDRDDIGSNALNLSAEEVQQTLSSVSADSALPDLSLPCSNAENNPPSNVNERLHGDVLNEDIDFDSNVDRVELRGILSSPSSSNALTTSTTTVVTSATDAAASTVIATSLVINFCKAVFCIFLF